MAISLYSVKDVEESLAVSEKRFTIETQNAIVAMAALGMSPEDCQKKLPDFPLAKVKSFLRRKAILADIEKVRESINRDVRKIPIANLAVQVRVLDTIQETQGEWSEQYKKNEKDNLAVQLLESRAKTIAQITELTGTKVQAREPVQDNRTQTNIFTTIVQNAPPEERGKLLSGFSGAIREQLVAKLNQPVIDAELVSGGTSQDGDAAGTPPA